MSNTVAEPLTNNNGVSQTPLLVGFEKIQAETKKMALELAAMHENQRILRECRQTHWFYGRINKLIELASP